MNYVIGTSFHGSLLGNSVLANWYIFERIPNSTIEQIKSVQVYGLGHCQGALYLTYGDEVYNVGYFGFLPCCAGTKEGVWGDAVKIEGLCRKKIDKIRVGQHYGIAISKSGTLYHWGRPLNKLHCCKSPNELDYHSPHQLVGFCHVAKDVACGETFFVVLSDSREVLFTGCISKEHKYFDKLLLSPENVDISSISCGAHHIAMVSVDGRVYTCGWGIDGQLGYHWNESDGYVNPRQVEIPELCIQTACGRNSTIFLTRSGTIWACGWNDNFAKLCVKSDEVMICPPLKVNLDGPFKEIASSYWATCSIYAAMTSNESVVYKWGYGCWSGSCDTIPRGSLLDAFVDFPTPPNLGFCEQPNDEDATFKHYDTDFDWQILSASDILFEPGYYEAYNNVSPLLQNTCCDALCAVNQNSITSKEDFITSAKHEMNSVDEPPKLAVTDSCSKRLLHVTNNWSINNQYCFYGLNLFLYPVILQRNVLLFIIMPIIFGCISVILITSTFVIHSGYLTPETNVKNDVTESYCINWIRQTSYVSHNSVLGNSQNGMDRNLIEFLGNLQFSDITIKTSNLEIPAHKIILYNRSTHFRKLLSADPSLSWLNLTAYDAYSTKTYLKYVYARTINELDLTHLLVLNEMAKQFDENDLFSYTLCQVGKKICLSNLKEVLTTAQKTGSKEIEEIGIAFVKKWQDEGRCINELVLRMISD